MSKGIIIRISTTRISRPNGGGGKKRVCQSSFFMIQVQSCFCTDKDMSWDCGLTSRPFDQNKSEKDGEFTSNGQGRFQMNNSTFLESEREIKQDAYLLASFVEG